VFATTGLVVDPSDFTALGTLPASGPLLAEPESDVVCFLDRSGGRIVSCNPNTFLQTGALKIAAIGGSSRRIVRAGNDAVAFIADDNTVAVVRHPMFGP
jgi:hypothetical protein